MDTSLFLLRAKLKINPFALHAHASSYMKFSDTKFGCCFCGETVERVKPDVSSLLYLACFDRSEEEQSHQQLFCHAECLRSRLHKSAKLYAVDLVMMDFLERNLMTEDDVADMKRLDEVFPD